MFAAKCEQVKEPSIRITDITFHATYDSLLDDSIMQGAFFDSWGVRDSLPDYYKGTIHYTSDTIPYLLFEFEGTSFELSGMKDRHLGIMRVRYDSIDVMIDNYALVRLDTSGIIYASPKLPWGWHCVHVTNTGLKNDSASATHLIIDAVRVVADIPVIKQRMK